MAHITRQAACTATCFRTCAQVMIIPISDASVGYANRVRGALRGAKLHCNVDGSDRKMQKKVREAQLAQYNYILVRAPCGFIPRQITWALIAFMSS